MKNAPLILQDRTSIVALEESYPELARVLDRSRLGKKAGRQGIQFCGLAWVTQDIAAMFLPRKSFENDTSQDIETARLTMRTLALFGREMVDRVGISSGGEGETGLLAIIYDLVRDFLTYGIYSERLRFQSLNSGKPNWSRTVVRENAFLNSYGDVVYPNIRTTRSQDAMESLLARIQVGVLLEITKEHGWWLNELSGREEELTKYKLPTLARPQWVTHLRLTLPKLYGVRAVNLATSLISYLESDRDRRAGEVYFGVEDFHTVWEHMLRRVLKGVEAEWNSRLPRPIYQKITGGLEIQERGLQTDIVLREKSDALCIVDAKYYDATSISNSPALPDIVKQLFYDLALKSIATGFGVKGCFIFPRLPDEVGVYDRIEMRHRDGKPVPTFPAIQCYYMAMKEVMLAYVEGRKIRIPAVESVS